MAYKKLFKHCSNEPKVSIGSHGNLYLNAFVMRDYFRGVKHIILLFDEKKNLFAIKPAGKQTLGVYILGFSSSKSKSTGYISARGFAKLPFVAKYKGKQLKANWNEKEKMLEVKLCPKT